MKTRLQEWRERRFLSMRELAKKSGVKANTISDIERGIRVPRYDTMKRLADALDITVDDLSEASRVHAA